MGTLLKLDGKRYGDLTVLHRIGKVNSHVTWLCACTCGNEVEVIGSSLLNGNTQSCGCLRQRMGKESIKTILPQVKNLIGERFGRLVVMEQWDKHIPGTCAVWRCLCDCGNEILVRGDSLRNGHTQSCGCLQLDLLREKNGERCHLWKGGVTPVHTAIRNSQKYKTWRKEIFKRDHYRCCECDGKQGGIQVHHKESFSSICQRHRITTLEKGLKCSDLWNMNNGVTLCSKCHKEKH